MKSRVFPFISILALLVAMTAASTAFAQSSPGQDVYNPNGEVLDVVQGGGNPTPAPESKTAPTEENGTTPAPAKQESGSSPSVCSAADGRDASGNAVSYGSSADCATASAASASSGELPFTGFQAGLVALAGLALVGTGFAMRRVSRSDTA